MINSHYNNLKTKGSKKNMPAEDKDPQFPTWAIVPASLIISTAIKKTPILNVSNYLRVSKNIIMRHDLRH